MISVPRDRPGENEGEILLWTNMFKKKINYLRAYVEGCGFGLQLCVVLHVLGHSWVISP
jgi:hypothetical protein